MCAFFKAVFSKNSSRTKSARGKLGKEVRIIPNSRLNTSQPRISALSSSFKLLSRLKCVGIQSVSSMEVESVGLCLRVFLLGWKILQCTAER